jgi:hypothetical protein
MIAGLRLRGAKEFLVLAAEQVDLARGARPFWTAGYELSQVSFGRTPLTEDIVNAKDAR